MSQADSAAMLYLSAGVLIGLGQSGTTFGIILAWWRAPRRPRSAAWRSAWRAPAARWVSS